MARREDYEKERGGFGAAVMRAIQRFCVAALIAALIGYIVDLAMFNAQNNPEQGANHEAIGLGAFLSGLAAIHPVVLIVFIIVLILLVALTSRRRKWYDWF